MIKVIPKKTFLLRQEKLDGGKTKDIIAHAGKAIEVTDAEAVKFYGYFKMTEPEEKKLLKAAKDQKLTRTV